ncbi:MAG: NUDIX hydrolase [Patescibacteria group bacterium]
MDNGNSDQSGVKSVLSEAYDLVYNGWIRVWRGTGRKQEVVEKKDAVAFLVYNRDRRAVAMVMQDRPATIFATNHIAPILEVPAGHIDQGETVVWAMAREAREELGLLVDLETVAGRFELINFGTPLFTSPGIITERLHLGYGKFNDDEFDHSRTSFGLDAEGESTEVRWISIKELSCMPYPDLKTFTLVQWFMLKIYPQLTAEKENE